MFGLFKPKKIEILNPSEFIKTMEKISHLLFENGFEGQANAFLKPIQYLKENDVEKFEQNFNTVDIWGGPGAAWEVGGFTSWKTEREFLVQFRKLIQLMKEAGIKNGKAKSIDKLFLRTMEEKD